ncbi:MAG: tRNA (adenosine(37)-N6)-threonylcarbamoyltransferase complex ATPase subunit type 1 TsaE [Chromatiales bacterium]
MSLNWRCGIDTEAEMDALAARFARAIGRGAGTVFLSGDLGAGKTTFVRGLLKALGYRGLVKSPTYTLVETYSIGGRSIYHFDLYRLAGSEELEAIGVRDFVDGQTLCLIEWPERGALGLLQPDLHMRIALAGEQRDIACEAYSECGNAVLNQVSEDGSRIRVPETDR